MTVINKVTDIPATAARTAIVITVSLLSCKSDTTGTGKGLGI